MAAAAFSLALLAAPAGAAGATVGATWSENVLFTEATLAANVNPEGAATTYHFKWGTTTSYGNTTPELAVGSDSSVHKVSRLLEGLAPGTTYHYRVVTTSGGPPLEGPDRTFSTYERVAPDTACSNQAFRTGASAALPTCRAYEMVSPVDKNGGDILSLGVVANQPPYRYMQSSTDGERLTYSSFKAFGDAPSNRYGNQYLASRGTDGWSTHGISAPLGETTFGAISQVATRIFFQAFTPDLSVAWLIDNNKEPLAPGGLEGIGAPGVGENYFYSRDNETDTFHTLVKGDGYVQGYSDDLEHVVIKGGVAGREHVFDIHDGEGHLVSVLPDGTVPVEAFLGADPPDQTPERSQNLTNAVAADGSRIFFTREGIQDLFVRVNPAEEQSAKNGSEECTEPLKACTIAVSGSIGSGHSSFWTASEDGSKALFTYGPSEELFTFDVDTQTPSLVAPAVAGVLGASEDLSYIYFVSTADLAPGASGGEPNLYVDHEGDVRFIATLSTIDLGGSIGPNKRSEYNVAGVEPLERASRITPDGRHIAFQSVRALTEYDIAGADNGEPHVEVYTYDADADELLCASCNPSGARPLGDKFRYPYSTGDVPVGEGIDPPVWAAAWLPTWEYGTYGSHPLSDDGDLLFFNSYDALVPEDTNGVQDVYQWEAEGSGDCARPGGCVGLISSGESLRESEFIDASPDGRDVFFETSSSLLPQDPALIDIYDARIGGGFPQPEGAKACFGDACQNVPPAPSGSTPSSATFRGPGNPALRKAQRKAQRRCRARNRNSAKATKKGTRTKAKRCTRSKRRAKR